MKASELKDEIAGFAPTALVHMAARTDCVEDTTVEEGYAVNAIGTRNVLDAVRATPSISRVIIVSTQYVAGPGRLPDGDEDYFPHTVYGQSKVITEQLTRKAGLNCAWTIIRPTNVWGPWHFRYSREALRVIKKGFYFHPNGPPVVCSYAYVGNVVWQIEQILKAEVGLVNQQVYYVGDKPVEMANWVDAFSMALRGRHIRRVPLWLLRGVGFAGDVLKIAGVRFPLTSSRLKSMTRDYVTPMDKTFEVFGEPPFDLHQGVAETVKWLQVHCGYSGYPKRF